MFSPAGQAPLQGGRRSTYTGRMVRHEPVWLARLEPGSSVMAKGLRIEEPITTDVAVGVLLDARDDRGIWHLAEQVREAPLRPEVVLDRGLPADFRHRGNFPVHRLVNGEQTGFLGEARDPDRLLGSMAPSERAGDEDVDVA